ncbi:MAG: AAA family ATPase [Methanospirillaceae archaeon]|nr:AAA family ATPase [Methanospirillaceae archaeon]
MTPVTIGIAGKGGTGKTTIASLLIRCLIEQGIEPILAVDADPNANLHEALGVTLTETLGSMREEAFTRSIPAGMTRADYIALQFRKTLVENRGFDLIAMGRPEGSGCYCFANDLLTTAMQNLGQEYRFIIVDNEAGMEHISRGTIGIPDLLLVISDPGARGRRTADRIKGLAVDLGMDENRIVLVINRAGPGIPHTDAFFSVPLDPGIDAADRAGDPVSRVPAGSPAREAVCELGKKIYKDPGIGIIRNP